jgi:hypothetical protein
MDSYRTTPHTAKENRPSLAPQTASTPYETIYFKIHLSRRQVKKNPSKMGNLGRNPVVTTCVFGPAPHRARPSFYRRVRPLFVLAEPARRDYHLSNGGNKPKAVYGSKGSNHFRYQNLRQRSSTAELWFCKPAKRAFLG